MNRIDNLKSSVNKLWFVFGLLVVVVSGCTLQTQPQSSTDVNDYTGVLDVSFEDTLDPINQLALGILQLAGTPNAVATNQAILLLPMWEALQGPNLKSDAERMAVVLHIESILDENQISAIKSMELTTTDAYQWLEDQGNDGSTGQTQGAKGEERSESEMPRVSDEPRASLAKSDISANGTSGISTVIMRAVVQLLSTSESEVVDNEPVIEPVIDDTRTESESKAPAQPTPTPEPIVEMGPVDAEPEPTSIPEVVKTETLTPEPAPEQPIILVEVERLPPSSGQETTAQVVSLPVLEQIQDTDPGPPFSVEITTNYAVPNPDLEQGWIYTVGGFIRNDSNQTYSLSAVHVTFFDVDGFKGAFYPFPSSGGGRSQSGEWITHGRMEADFACLVLAPGQTCPFIVEIAAHDMGSFLVHPDAVLLEWHEAASAELNSISLTENDTAYVQINGTVHNANAYAIKNVMVTGVLSDDMGQWVSYGTATILESIEPGADVDFEVWVEKVPYVDYTLYVAAEGDFN